ncbi:semialdehyde dehydrogenase [Neisseria animalis]|uniref:semialdehyde dehydrogenase n=1 Tax=Neisseria animalis TaxID=492 RepID=UPI000F6EA189|nr:semialdehyde dehydrogenase [Neisseria animalis]VEE08176.1 Uncharacterised protein [Neisseria animalis]
MDIFVRREAGITHEKLRVNIVDFEDEKNYTHLVYGDVLFSCLGTTLKTAGSKEAQWQVDYEGQLAFAQAAKSNGVNTLVLVSAGYASPGAKTFYFRMKGQLEEAVGALAFENLLILRPPLLLRQGSDRMGEVWAAKILNALNAVGLLKSMRPMPTGFLAGVMVRAAKSVKGAAIWEAAGIWQKQCRTTTISYYEQRENR